MSPGFNNELYYTEQVNAFSNRIIDGVPTIIEFGGKPFGDFHASRVLPGYDPDVKAAIIRDVHQELVNNIITMAVHAKDILAAPNSRRPNRRLRGDYGITYEEEALRMADEARHRHDIPVEAIAITAMPPVLSTENAEFVERYTQRLKNDFDIIRVLPEIPHYPYVAADQLVDSLTSRKAITKPGQSTLIISPGGGSGKFSVVATEIAHKLRWNIASNYIKFETFPVFHLTPEHPLNRAFIAATADLGNQTVTLENGLTNYNKDVGNFALLGALLAEFPNITTPMSKYKYPTDMGVNVIESGITDVNIVSQACQEEIMRRMARYKNEISQNRENTATAIITNALLAQ